ncbi:hypothetical protein Clacol_001216 [Clathrus columnatus]|uniref:Uncharacterized protein n=1 Tax=Clathrus columnatus TaxID=1419009 RepID=A0AAV5A312_9AGAM|nr:hypothetical protein Clacol_001216 [Clathrus columnatus]
MQHRLGTDIELFILFLTKYLVAHPNVVSWAVHTTELFTYGIRSPKVAVAKGGKILITGWCKGMGVLRGEDVVEIWKIGENDETVFLS